MVVLCAPDGTAIGTRPKRYVHHRHTPLHLAFSCYLFDEEGRILLTRRALTKTTWPGIATNSCCGHPAPEEALDSAIERRVSEELGVDPIDIKLVLPAFSYRAEMRDGTIENELCPVFTAMAGPTTPTPNPAEVDSCWWEPWSTFAGDVLAGERQVSPWCALQVVQLARLGDDPVRWPAVDTSHLPAAARP
jgi:isopentenyl-diphosphate Delta-isomerase